MLHFKIFIFYNKKALLLRTVDANSKTNTILPDKGPQGLHYELLLNNYYVHPN